ncbi:MAG TPA: winged helix-turn-helix domain-containing protein [Methylibium sp.]|nr:winged helix-turn-helix domain-containing protein [Methylibium sp.]
MLQPAERRLFVDGQPVALGARALDLLVALATQPDHLLSKNELLGLVWPGLVVEEANLHVQVSNLRKLLGSDAIVTVPGRGYRFAAAVVADLAATAGPVVASNLLAASAASAAVPQAIATARPAQRLIGRDADRVALETLLASAGCVTLVGTAGVGKTSLSRQVAAGWSARSAFVELATLSKGDEVPDTVARALNLQLDEGDRAEQIVRALSAESLLLVLDNAEHLVQAVAELAARLQALGALRLLVTSQLPLNVAGERVYRLLPLALPAAAASGSDNDAVALLVERIVAADRRFEATEASRPLLEAICTQLDGLPLALEMAAARVPALGLSGVRDALYERFAMLTRGHRDATTRHRTLRNALDWSYRLLGEAEQRVFRTLGVFAAGFTLDLAVALLADGDDPGRWDIIDALTTLIDHSLLVASADDPPRYHLLETMRAFALGELATSGAEPAARERAARALLALVERFGTPGSSTAGGEIRGLCEAEMGNIRDALDWLRERDLALAVHLAAQASFAATFSLWRSETTRWLLALEPALVSAAGRALPAELQAFYWTELGRKLLFRGDPRANVLARRGFELWQPLGRPAGTIFAAAGWVRCVARAGDELDAAVAALDAQRLGAPGDLSPRLRLNVHGALALAAERRGDLAAVLAAREAEVALAREFGFPEAAVIAESNVVNTLSMLGRHDEALLRGEALLARVDAADGDRNPSMLWILEYVIHARAELGRLDEAHALIGRLWQVMDRTGEQPGPWLPAMALLAALRGRASEAALLIGRLSHGGANPEVTYQPIDLQRIERARAIAREALGKAEIERLIAAGAALDDAAVRTSSLR